MIIVDGVYDAALGCNEFKLETTWNIIVMNNEDEISL